MSKQSKLKVSSEVTNGNSKDSRRPSVFDRLGSRFNSSTEGICKAWVQNSTCPYGKSCKYSNSHIVLSSLKRSSRKDIDYQLRVYKGERSGKSPDDGLDKWDSADLECADEKVLEKRLMLLQKELQKQMKGEEDHRSAYSSSKHSKLSLGAKKCSKRVGRSTSSDSSDSTSSVSSSSSAESSSSSSSDSVHRKHGRVPGKSKRRSGSSYSDEHVSKKIKHSKSVKGKSPVMNRRLSRSRSPVGKKLSSPSSKKSSSKLSPVSRTASKHNRHAFTPPTEKCKSPGRKHSPRSNKHLSIEHRDKHRSVSPLVRQREREYDKSREHVRSKSPKAKGRMIAPCKRSEHQKIIKRKESPEKLRNSRLTPEKHIITRKISPPRSRQNDIRNDDKRRDEKLRSLKEDHRRVAPRIVQDKREDERLRERRVREAARERERKEALERCQERQRQRELAKVKAEREKEKARELERSKERVREPDRRTVIRDRVRLPDREEKTLRVRERSFERTVSAKIKLNDSYNRDERARTVTKSRDRGRSYERDQLSVDKERAMLKDRNLERILVHDAVKNLDRRGSHERSIVRERVLDRERDCSLSRGREVEARRVLAADDKGYDSPFRVRDERGGRYLNEADERSHFKDSPLREETRQIRIHPDDRRREVVGGRNSWEEKRPPHDWEAHREWDTRLRRSGLHHQGDGWDRRRKGDNEDWGRYSKEWPDREWRKDWTPRNVQVPPLPGTRDDPVAKNTEDKSIDSKKKSDVGGPLEEELSDISDEADDILTREDAGGERLKTHTALKKSPDMTAKEAIEDDLRKITQKKISLNKMLSPNTGALQDTLEDSLKSGSKDGTEQLDFEEISDEELEDEARARITLGDALGVDWASLIAETRPKPRLDADAALGSAKKQWDSARLLERLGVSVKYAGSETIKRLLNKHNNSSIINNDKDIKSSDEFRTNDSNTETNDLKNVKDDMDDESVKQSEDETRVKPSSNPIAFLHPVAGIHVALRERQQKRRTLFNSINRALSARSDIALRRQLCGLPIRNIEVQQTTGFYQWVV